MFTIDQLPSSETIERVLLIILAFSGPVFSFISVINHMLIERLNARSNVLDAFYFLSALYVTLLCLGCIICLMNGTVLLVPAIYAITCIVLLYNINPDYIGKNWADNCYGMVTTIVSVAYTIFLIWYFFLR